MKKGMRKKCYLQGLVFLSLSAMSLWSAEWVPAAIKIEETRSIKKAERTLLGIQNDWPALDALCALPDRAGYDPKIVEALKGFPMPLNRAAGTSGQKIDWKGAIGPYEQRTEQKLANWYPKAKKTGLGPVEWIQMVLAIDPTAEFVWTLNFHLPPEDSADLAEFFTGTAGENKNGGIDWARRRIECGLPNPVKIALWEMGNELDGPEERAVFTSPEVYIEMCRKHMAAVRSVIPGARVAAHAATLSSLAVYAKVFGGSWDIWHKSILKDIGDQIDFLSFHPYVNSLPAPKLEGFVKAIEKDIVEITGEKRIKQFMSEHAWMPKSDNLGMSSSNWKSSWYQSHALMGCLGTADWMARMMNSESVTVATYHAFCGGPWGLVYKGNGEVYTTGIVDLYRLFDLAFKDSLNVVPLTTSGKNRDSAPTEETLNAAALSTARGIHLLLVNADPDQGREISFSFDGHYQLEGGAALSAESMHSFNKVDKKEIKVQAINAESAVFKTFRLPAKTVAVLLLKKS